jgi:hypothetical protein
MRFLITLVLANLLFWQPAFAVLYNSDKTQIFNKNLLVNGGFESGTSNWTASAGTFATTTTSPMIGAVHATWDAAASGNTLTSTAVTIPAGMYGRNMVASCLFTTASGTATHEIQAYDGSNVLSETTVTSSTTPSRASANFVAPSSGSLSLRIYANADEPSVAIDDCYLGPAEGYNVGQVSQAQFVGSLTYANTASCVWTTTSTTLGSFAADADCPTPTVVGQASAPGTKIPAAVFSNLGPGRYELQVKFQTEKTAVTNGWYAEVYNGTSGLAGYYGFVNNINNILPAEINAHFELTTATSSVTYEIRGKVETTGTLSIRNDLTASPGGQAVTFTLYKFPSTQEIAYTPDKLANSWAGYHGIGCQWDRTNTALGDVTDDASGCTLTETVNKNFGTVSTSGSVSPAITFTPTRAGTYYACATFVLASTATNPFVEAQLTDGTTVVATSGVRYIGSTGVSDGSSVSLCGLYPVTSVSAKTLKVQTASSTGLARILAPSVVRATLEWSIFQIDQSMPMPLMANSVVSPSSGVLQVVGAIVATSTGTASTVTQTGSWISSYTNTGTGDYTINAVANTFSAAPMCTCSTYDSSSFYCTVVSTTSSAMRFRQSNAAGTLVNGSGAGLGFSVVCVGPK